MGSLFAASDLHWEIGNPSDIADYKSADAIVEATIAYRPLAFVIVGDWLDFWRSGRNKVLAFQAQRIRELAFRFRLYDIPFYWVPGNHDYGDPEELSQIMGELHAGSVHVMTPKNMLFGWTFTHGNEFGDAFNNPESPLFPLAHGLTRGSAWVKDHVWSKYDESRLNPVNWFSPANKGEEAKKFLHQQVCDYAAEHQLRVCYGHTHRAGHADGDGWAVVNCGSVTTTRPSSYVILPEDHGTDPEVVWIEKAA